MRSIPCHRKRARCKQEGRRQVLRDFEGAEAVYRLALEQVAESINICMYSCTYMIDMQYL